MYFLEDFRFALVNCYSYLKQIMKLCLIPRHRQLSPQKNQLGFLDIKNHNGINDSAGVMLRNALDNAFN